jgi:hypothetical protein
MSNQVAYSGYLPYGTMIYFSFEVPLESSFSFITTGAYIRTYIKGDSLPTISE